MEKRSSYFQIYDVTKIFLSFLIVAIHTGLWPQYLYPWLRIAVPLFFVISSYLLFCRMKEKSEEVKTQIIRRCIARNLQLYLFWFIVLLPITLYSRNYYRDGLILGLLRMIHAFLFSSTFFNSWFIMALVIGTLFVYFLSHWLRNRQLIIIGILFFLFATFSSSYSSIFPASFLSTAASKYEAVFSQPYKSFPISIFWVAVGKAFAESERINIKKIFLIVMSIGSAALLVLEWKIVGKLGGSFRCDSYLMLAPLCCSLFGIIKSFDSFSTKYDTQLLRKVSTILYTTHGSVATVISGITNRFLGINAYGHSFCLTLITVFISFVIAFAIIAVSQKKRLQFLKYAY